MSNPLIYKYEPLSSTRSIRVINLKGTSGSLFRRSTTDSILEVKLEEVSLDSSPSYEALSYTWDGQVPDRPIRCHGKIMKVTKNCERALLRLRNQSSRRLWIDSICINQDSMSEKSSQIPLMGAIYGKCSRVLVWLGEGTEASDCGIRYLRDISLLLQQVVVGNIPTPSANPRLPYELEQKIWQRKLTFQEENKQIYGLEGFTTDFNILADIFNRPWFSRMWTIQELVLGFRASILCGQSELPWSDFISAITCLANFEQANTKLLLNESLYFSKLQTYQKLRNHIHPQLAHALGPQDKRMSKIFTSVHPLNSWNPRDKMYALYGYLAIFGITNLPPVDYNLPVAQVYSDFTKAAMLHDQSLDLLYDLGCKRVIQDLPSWSPDWSTYTEHLPILHEQFKATKNSSLRFIFTEEKELHLPGIVIDTVKHRPNLSIPPEISIELGRSQNVYLPNMIQRIQTWQQWISLVARLGTYPTGQKVSEALLKTLVQDGVYGPLPRHKLSDQVLKEFPVWFNMLQAYHPNQARKEICINAINHAIEMALNSPGTWKVYFSDNQDPLPVINTPEWRIMLAVNYGGAQNIHHWIYRMTAGKTIFTTGEGYMGIGSDLIQEGDKVVLIPSFNLPMVVRGCEDGSHHFVSPAYVHGIMDGEKWPDNEADMLTYFFFSSNILGSSFWQGTLTILEESMATLDVKTSQVGAVRFESQRGYRFLIHWQVHSQNSKSTTCLSCTSR